MKCLWSTSVAALALCGVMAGGSAVAGTSRQPAAQAEIVGTYITGLGRVGGHPYDPATGIVTDSRGGLHFITASYNATTFKPTFRYFTKLPGRNLSERTLPRPPGVIDTFSQTVVSANGKKAYGIVANCRAIATTETPIKALTMPRPVPIVGTYLGCHPPENEQDYYGAVAVPHGKVAIFVARDNETPGLMVGKPGGRFRLAANQPPALVDSHWGGMVRDPQTGKLVVYTEQSFNEAPHELLVAVGTGKHGWSKVQDLGTLSDTYGIPSVTAAHGHVAVAVSHYDPSDPGTSGTMIFDGNESGRWQPPTTPTGFTAADTQAYVAEGKKGDLTLGYEHCDGPSSGGTVNTIQRVGGSWGTPTVWTPTEFSSVTSIALKSGDPHVQYLTSLDADGTFCHDGGPEFHDGPPYLP